MGYFSIGARNDCSDYRLGCHVVKVLADVAVVGDLVEVEVFFEETDFVSAQLELELEEFSGCGG